MTEEAKERILKQAQRVIDARRMWLESTVTTQTAQKAENKLADDLRHERRVLELIVYDAEQKEN